MCRRFLIVVQMNIFFISFCVRECAQQHFDSHVIKMILELTQLLSAAWHVLDPELASQHLHSGLIYKKTHQNHPCAIWTRAHVNNYRFVGELAHELCDEWRRRWGHDKTHGSEPRLTFLFDNYPPSIPSHNIQCTPDNPHCFTFPMPQSMPDECKVNPESSNMDECVQAYRNYYSSPHKQHLHKWTINKQAFTPCEWISCKA